MNIWEDPAIGHQQACAEFTFGLSGSVPSTSNATLLMADGRELG